MPGLRSWSRTCYLVAAALGAWLSVGPNPVRSCSFGCFVHKLPTLAADHKQAAIVVVGSFTNAKKAENSTDFVIEKVVKFHPTLKAKMKVGNGKKVITLPRYLPQLKNKLIVFADLANGEIDAYRGVELERGSTLLPYFIGAISVKDGPMVVRVRYFFDHLNSPDPEVASDALREIDGLDFKEYMHIAKELPADRLVRWLQDPSTPPDRYGLYAALLAQCGRPENTKVLRAILDQRDRPRHADYGRVFAACVILDAKKSWPYLTGTLTNLKQDFPTRYAALRAVRFLWDYRPEVVGKKNRLDALALVLADSEMADLAIEEVRKRQAWEFTDHALNLFGKESYDTPIVRRSIVRFALCSPALRAADFVQRQRRIDPVLVNDMEESLKLELEAGGR
jgi:hypothetical protein